MLRPGNYTRDLRQMKWGSVVSLQGSHLRTALFDDLVCPAKERERDYQLESLCSLEIDHEPELGRLLDWKISRLCALQDLVHVGSGLSERISKTGPIGHETALRHKIFRLPDQFTWRATTEQERKQGKPEYVLVPTCGSIIRPILLRVGIG
jgi:hypothetical protein